MSDLVGNPEDRFSHDAAQLISSNILLEKSKQMIERVFEISHGSNRCIFEQASGLIMINSPEIGVF